MSFWKNLFYRARQHDPGRAIVTPAKLYVGPPLDMTLDDLVTRRKRLLDVLPQFERKIARAVRKYGPEAAGALERKRDELRQQLAIYNARIDARLDGRR